MNPFSNKYELDNSDHTLIQEAIGGNRESLNDLIRRHYPYVFNIAWKMIGDPSKAEDLTQEAFVKIVRGLETFRFESTFRTWAYRIVYNQFINDVKKPNARFASSFVELGTRLDNSKNVELTAEEQQIRSEEIKEMKLQCLSGMILCLTKEQRLVYIIGELFKSDHTIGSEIMGVSRANYRMKLSKARKELNNFMQNKCGLVDDKNPCKCHKKVTVAMEFGLINAKELLYNKSEFSTFKNQLGDDADFLTDEVELIYSRIHQNTSFKSHFEKKSFIEGILDDENIKSRLNLH